MRLRREFDCRSVPRLASVKQASNANSPVEITTELQVRQSRSILELLRDHSRHFEDLVRITPLVVVPRHEFHERAVKGDASFGVKDACADFADEVGRDHFVLGVAHHAFHRTIGCSLDCRTDFVVGR